MSEVRAVDALMVIDIGNSRVGMAISDEDGIHDVSHLGTHNTDDWPATLDKTWQICSRATHRHVVIASVCPEQTRHMVQTISGVCGVEPLLVRDDLPLPLQLDVESPSEVGADRVCAAAAAYERINGACAVASFGTATTIDCVSADGHFLGGAILPGIAMSFDALHEHTALLPRAEFASPTGPFGKNTHDAILGGVVYGTVGAVREIVERFATALGEWPQLIATGGNAAAVADLADFIDAVVPNLCLMGIALAHRRATGQA